MTIRPKTHLNAYSEKSPAVPREPCRDSKEVAAMFGYATTQLLHNALNRGQFPEPDLVSGITSRRLFWKLSTLATEQRRRESAK
jgi:hypothetical protein